MAEKGDSEIQGEKRPEGGVKGSKGKMTRNIQKGGEGEETLPSLKSGRGTMLNLFMEKLSATREGKGRDTLRRPAT